MFGSEWIFDSHTILMIVLLIVSVIYLIQNSNNSNESQSKQLVPIKKRKRSRKEINETKENFSDNKKDPVSFVMYYVPWCPHCRTTKPHWKQLEDYAKASLPWASVKSVDCEKNPSEAEKNNIQYFPTIVITKGNESKEYEGKRDFESFKKFLENY